MCYVSPLRIFFDAVIEYRRPPCKFGNRLAIRTAFPFGIRISGHDTGLDLALETIPLLLRRFALHPPEHYMSSRGRAPDPSRVGRLPDPAVEPPLGDFPGPYAKAVRDLPPTV